MSPIADNSESMVTFIVKCVIFLPRNSLHCFLQLLHYVSKMYSRLGYYPMLIFTKSIKLVRLSMKN